MPDTKHVNVRFSKTELMLVPVDIDESIIKFKFDMECNSLNYAIEKLKLHVKENSLIVLNKESLKLFAEKMTINGSKVFEMEMFDVKRRDLISFKDFLKIPEKAGKIIENGKKKDKDKVLKEFTREIERSPMFSSPNYDPTYRAIDVGRKKKNVKQLELSPMAPYVITQPAAEEEKEKKKKKGKKK